MKKLTLRKKKKYLDIFLIVLLVLFFIPIIFNIGDFIYFIGAGTSNPENIINAMNSVFDIAFFIFQRIVPLLVLICVYSFVYPKNVQFDEENIRIKRLWFDDMENFSNCSLVKTRSYFKKITVYELRFDKKRTTLNPDFFEDFDILLQKFEELGKVN